jgi:hypothetical protein
LVYRNQPFSGESLKNLLHTTTCGQNLDIKELKRWLRSHAFPFCEPAILTAVAASTMIAELAMTAQGQMSHQGVENGFTIEVERLGRRPFSPLSLILVGLLLGGRMRPPLHLIS